MQIIKQWLRNGKIREFALKICKRRIVVSSKDRKMPGIASIFVIRSRGRVYLVELQDCLVRVVVWDVWSEQENEEMVQDSVVIIGAESGAEGKVEGNG